MDDEIHSFKSKLIANGYLPKQKEMRLISMIELRNMTVSEKLLVDKVNELTEAIQILADELIWQERRIQCARNNEKREREQNFDA